MPMFLASSKAIGRLSSWRHCAAEVKARLALLRNHQGYAGLSKIRCLSNLPVPTGVRQTGHPRAEDRSCFMIENHHSIGQTRCFLGCGDGEEGNFLSKIYEERRVIGYSPEQLFAVVAAVDLYQDFVPWCQRSKIIKHNDDGSFDAELEIGFKYLVESYISHVELKKPKSIKTTASQSGLFDHLINMWEFKPGPVPGTCDLYFLVDFKFQSPLYRQVASVFFKQVVERMIGSFSDRCRRIYGPGVRVLESSL